MAILNLTQHPASAEQIKAGVIDINTAVMSHIHAVMSVHPDGDGMWSASDVVTIPDIIAKALNFSQIPTIEEIEERADTLAFYAKTLGFSKAMIGGAPFLMGALERTLKEKGITPLYAFSERVSVEKTTETGEVVKTSTFKHKGFVEV